MTISSSRLSYRDCYELMDKALNTPGGVRALMGTEPEAWRMRLRLNKGRLLDRKINAATYDQSHPLYGGSEYDELIFTIKEDVEGGWWLYLERQKLPDVVEPIEEAAE